jgi:ABC-type transporter Mla MlaB component
VGIVLEQGTESNTICLDGAIDIGCAAELKEHLVQALGTGKRVCISLERVTNLDVTAYQLLWGAEREAKGLGVGFVYLDEPAEAVRGALVEAGLEEFAGPVKAN